MSGVRLAEVFLAACQEHGARDAVACDAVACAGEQLSYEQLATRVRRRAVALDAILGTGTERVGLYAHNSIDYVVSYFALLHTGRVPLLIDAQFGAHELGEVNAGCGVTAFLVDRARSGLFPLAGTTVPVAGSDHDLCRVAGGEVPAPRLHPSTAVCRFTSGTTGLPKCLEFSGAAVHAAATNWVDGTGLDGDDRTLCLAAFTNGLAFNTSLLASFLVGADLHIYRGLPTSSKIIASLAASQATRLVAFPVVYRLLVESDSGAEHCAGLQMAISAGTVLSAEVRAEFEGRSGVRIADYYGIAEVGPCTFERDPAYRHGLGSALPGVALRTVANAADQHEIQVRTASMATRYLNAPGLLESRLGADGFYASGDLGYLADGRLYVTGRVGGPINLAGRKVDPTEVEQAATSIDGVRDAVVIADRDATDSVILHLVLSTTRALDRGDIVAGCRGRLAPYKIPAKVSFVAEIPRSAAGKVRIVDLQQLLARTAEGASPMKPGEPRSDEPLSDEPRSDQPRSDEPLSDESRRISRVRRPG